MVAINIGDELWSICLNETNMIQTQFSVNIVRV